MILNFYGLILLNLKMNEESIKIDKVMPGYMGQLFCETPCKTYLQKWCWSWPINLAKWKSISNKNNRKTTWQLSLDWVT